MVGTLRCIVHMPLGEVLIDMGAITSEQLNIALREQAIHRGDKIGRVLIRLGFTTAGEIFTALQAQLSPA